MQLQNKKIHRCSINEKNKYPRNNKSRLTKYILIALHPLNLKRGHNSPRMQLSDHEICSLRNGEANAVHLHELGVDIVHQGRDFKVIEPILACIVISADST